MQKLKKFLPFLFSLFVLAGSSIPAFAQDLAVFEDLSPDGWYIPYIYECVDQGWMSGKSDTRFDPDGLLVRADLCVILYRMAGSPAVSKSSSFEDVPEDAYYYKAVEWAHSKGIAAGFNEKEFRPGQDITREQLVTFLYRYYSMRDNMSVYGNIDGIPGASEISEYAKEAMIWAVIHKALGVNGANLYPQRDATRAQCAKVLVQTGDEPVLRWGVVEINQTRFLAALENNPSLETLLGRMPFTKEMKLYQSGEWYSYLSKPIDSTPSHTSSLQTGDIKLFGEDCIFLFEQPLQNEYRFTPLMTIMDTRNLSQALSGNEVSVRFSLQQ